MVNWREIDVNTDEGRQQLRRVIAERLGWKIVNLNDNPHGLQVKGQKFVLYNPQGVEMCRAWTEAELFGKWYWVGNGWMKALVTEGVYFIPDYPNDLNAAASLFTGDYDLKISRREVNGNPDYVAVLVWTSDDNRIGWVNSGDGIIPTEAIARCLAWLAYMDERNADA